MNRGTGGTDKMKVSYPNVVITQMYPAESNTDTNTNTLMYYGKSKVCSTDTFILLRIQRVKTSSNFFFKMHFKDIYITSYRN